MNLSPTLNRDSAQLPRVLLVDDDELNLLVISIALRERGFSVREASSGYEALRIITDWYPDVLVLDAMMPGMDGFTTCQELRCIPGYESLPVLMLTGLDDEHSINRAYEVGATDFFIKNQQWGLLAGRLRYLLRSARTRQELEQSKAKLALAQGLARMGSVDWQKGDVRGLVFSQESFHVFGIGVNDHLSLRKVLRMIVPHERDTLKRMLHKVISQPNVLRHDFQITLPIGQKRVIYTEAEPQFNEHAQLVGFSGIVQDVTDRRNAEDRINHLANFDTLTGLPNRRQIFWRAERALEFALRLGHCVAVIQIGLDRFKVINENLGHQAGDELLMEVSRRLRSCVKHTEKIVDGVLDLPTHRGYRILEAVGRLGADEFVVLLPEVKDNNEALALGEYIQSVLRQPIVADGQECFITASLGIACFPGHCKSVADLMRNADVAMDMAKEQGRNNVQLYDHALASKGRIRIDLDTALHKALERQELILHYQPKIDTRTGLMTGAEALMRWERDGTLVSPGEFIPLAEATGLINEMSMWAIEEASRQAHNWKELYGFSGSIAVNMPSRMFSRHDLVDVVASIIKSQGALPHMIELEITETGLMKNLGGVVPSLHKLNQLGIEISIDDFGTGYSSLSYLTTLPISELKIDRSFVHDLGSSPQSAAIVSAIIALAKALGLRVIAEGVERLEQAVVLGEMGCYICQGFFYAKPMAAEKLGPWLQGVHIEPSNSLAKPLAI